MYTGSSDSWTTFAPLNQARRNHAGAFIVDSATSGRMWVGGGYVPDGTNVGTATTETYQVGTVPTAVSLTGFSANTSASARLPWLALGAALVVAAGALARRRLA